MKRQKYLVTALCGILIMGGLAGCSMAAAQNGGTSTVQERSSQGSQETAVLFAIAEGDSEGYNEASYEELYKPYEQFGLVYNADKNELRYNGKLVRWFEDYYPISEDGAQAGTDFFNESGVVDVYAVRDLSSLVYNNDGSFDPSGKLIGVYEFSEEEFVARDIEAIKNPQPITLISGDRMLTTKELENMAKEYEMFGVTYDAKDNQWYFNGEKVRFFRDILTSNDESLTNGKFKGTMRTLGGNGTVDIYTVRDFSNLDASGNGTLIGIEKFSQEEFDERTKSSVEIQTSSGECTVIQE